MRLSPQDHIKQPLEDGEIPEPFDDVDVQEDWEDVSDAEQDSPHEIMISSANELRTASIISLQRRARRGPSKGASPAPSRFQSIKGRKKNPIMKKEELEEALTNGVRFTASVGADVLKGSILKMRKPLSWILVLYMLTWMVSRMASAFRETFAPLCVIPGISHTMLCVPIQPAPTINFDKLVNIQGSTFEQLVGESVGSSQLSIEVIRAEMATRDLSLLVRYSELKSREDIADMLRTIGSDAKKTGRGLSKLDAKVVGAIDEVMALNNYAMTTIESADKKAPSPLLQAISPIKLGPSAEEIVAGAFALAMSESEQAIGKLRVEAEVSWQNLEQLDADIGVLHEIITREDKHTAAERDQLLGELWTKLGGNKKAVRDNGDRLVLLNGLGEYRRRAVAHVKATLRALHTMSDDLEVLRERVAAPGLLESKIPLHVHMESIKNGLERLQEGRRASRRQGIEEEIVKMLLKGDPNEIV